jgi:hypothetical protein
VAVLGEHLVADAAAPDIVEVPNTLLPHEVANGFVRRRGLLRLGGDPVIEHDHDLASLPHVPGADFLKGFADQVGVLVGHRQVNGGDHNFVGRDRIAP